MSKKSFIDFIATMFNENISKKKSKKQAIKKLIAKLTLRRKKLKKRLKFADAKEKADIKNSIAIIKHEIKKGKKLLNE